MNQPGEIRVLGPVEVIGPQGVVELIGARQQALIGVLALRVGQVVSQSQLVDALWGDRPPRTAVKTLHSHMARVRRALGARGLPDVLVTRGPGYLLAMPPDAVDARRFEAGVQAAREELSGEVTDSGIAGLRAHLALWRGEAFTDAELFGWATAEVERLHEARLAALEDVWDAELRMGRHRAAVGELEKLLVHDALRERLVGLYMLALYRCGRHTEALHAYQRLRGRLADEWGVDPSPDLIDLYTAILRGEPHLAAPDGAAVTRPSTTPAQLPARAGHFAGRAAELDALDRMLAEHADDPPLVVISGPGGMGKTALAVQWAHRIADRYPHGHLFLDLRAHDGDRAMTAAEALPRLLRGLGVPGDRVPVDLSEQSALFRSLLYGKRMLLLLDNCHATEVVLPLVPGTSTSVVILTSRTTLPALAARHAVHPVHLDALADDEAVSLLALVLGADRVRREPVAATELVGLCGRMPLALRIAAAKLAGQPARPIGGLVVELAGANRLDVLSVEGDSYSVRAVFAGVYRSLTAAAARAFRLLGLHPGPTISTSLVSAVCDVSPHTAAAAVAELRATHLITEAGTDRYRFHDLIRLFANQCALVDEQPADREEAIGRTLDWYLTVAHAANRLVEPGRDHVVPSTRHVVAELPFTDDRTDALAFLDAERDNLMQVVDYATGHDHHTTAWQLTYLLTSFFDVRGHWTERTRMCRMGVAAAHSTGDPRAEGEMLRALGVAYHMTRRFDDALAAYREALVHVRACGDRAGEGHIHGNIANAYTQLRRFAEAETGYRRVLAMHQAEGNAIGVILAQRNLGYAYIQMGRSDRSLAPLTLALATSREVGNLRLEAATLDSLGQACLHQERYDEAADHFRDAVAIGRRIGDRWVQSAALTNIGAVLLRCGDDVAALENLREALVITREFADPHGEATTLTLIGQAHLRLGDVHAARDRLQLALALRERVPDSYEEAHLHRNLGDLEQHCGNQEAAAHHWALAVRLYREANAGDESEALDLRVRSGRTGRTRPRLSGSS